MLIGDSNITCFQATLIWTQIACWILYLMSLLPISQATIASSSSFSKYHRGTHSQKGKA